MPIFTWAGGVIASALFAGASAATIATASKLVPHRPSETQKPPRRKRRQLLGVSKAKGQVAPLKANSVNMTELEDGAR